MYDIITIGEIIVEIMRDTVNIELNKQGNFIGPFPSGAPAIFIDAASCLGLKTTIIGGVGNDDFGKCIIDKLSKDNVDCSFIQIEDNYYTGCAFVTYFDNGDRKFIFHIDRSAATEYKKIEILPDTKVFHIMGCSLNASKKIAKQINKALNYYVDKGKVISFDPNVRMEMIKSSKDLNTLKNIMKKTNIFLPGVKELLILSECENEIAAINKCINEYNMEIIVVKDGSNGARVYTKDRMIKSSVYNIQQKDPTGAGDCFDAGFIGSICKGYSLEDSIKIASACGALNAKEFGPMEALINDLNINQMINTKNIIKEI